MRMNDRELLARTLMAEAGNQGYGGQIAAGSVIMNRVGSGGYGTGLRGVMLQPGQFSVLNGITGYAGGEQGQDIANMTPSAESYKAADDLIAGNYSDPTGGALNYYNDAISNPNWGQARAGGEWRRIGDHLFGTAGAGRSVGSDTMAAIGRPQNTGGQRMAMQPTQRQGILGSLGIQKQDRDAQGDTALPFYQRDNFKDAMGRAAIGFNTLRRNPDANLAGSIVDGRKGRQNEVKSNRTMQWLASQPNSAPFVEMIRAGGSPAGVLQAYQTSVTATSNPNVQSSSALRDNSGVVMTMRDGSVSVVTAGGGTLTGSAAMEFVADANARFAEGEQAIFDARRTGTNEANIETGGQSARVIAEGEDMADMARTNVENAAKIANNLTNIDASISAIDRGANAGMIYKNLPRIEEASASLQNSMDQMGLDVIGSVTFGALSKGELDLAMAIAVPRNLSTVELRKWFVRRRAAQEKAHAGIIEAARYFSSANPTMQGWLEKMDSFGDGTSTADPASTTGSLTFNPATGKFE